MVKNGVRDVRKCLEFRRVLFRSPRKGEGEREREKEREGGRRGEERGGRERRGEEGRGRRAYVNNKPFAQFGYVKESIPVVSWQLELRSDGEHALIEVSQQSLYLECHWV